MSALRFSSEAEFFAAFSGKIPKHKHKKQKVVIAGGYQSHVKGWRKIGGKRYYLKSLWEMNYAHYLEYLKKTKQIYDWKYEPKLFRFPTSAYKAGPFYYKPDFKVYESKTFWRWHEVKGVLNPKSKKKIKRFEKHYPKQGKIILIDKHWFKHANKQIGKTIPGWATYGDFLRQKEAVDFVKNLGNVGRARLQKNGNR